MSSIEDPQATTAASASHSPLPNQTEERIALPPRPEAPPAPPAVSPEQRLARLVALDRLLIGLVLILAFLMAFFPIRNSDFFQQLAFGRLLSQGGYHFGAEPFTWTGEPWVNHSWLFGWGLYLLYLVAPGGQALVCLKSLLIAGLASVLLLAGRRVGQRLWIAAVCTALAMIVVSPYLVLRPILISFVFLALTLWLLERPRLRREARAAAAGSPAVAAGDERSWWLIPVLFAVWVNLDAWFLLGTLTVALYLLGAILQQQVGPAPTGPDRLPAGSLARLGGVFLASLAACLLNPYHIHAFAPPALLGLSDVATVLQEDGHFTAAFASPLVFRGPYFNPGFGLSVAGLSYFVLLLLAPLSLVLAPAFRWWRALLLAAFAALSLYSVRTIPFYAIVAGPITALNFLDLAAVRRRGAVAVRSGEILWLTGGRWLSVVALLLLLTASVPGWLQARPHVLRRPGWGIDPDPSLIAAAQQVAQWRKQGLIPAGERWFNTSPELANYFSWFCPDEKLFIDQRISLNAAMARDYVDTLRALAPLNEEQSREEGPKWRDVFAREQVRYLLYYETSPTALLVNLMGNEKEFTLLYMDGRTAMFGWQDPTRKPAEGAENPYAPIRLDVERLAFGPQARPAPEHRPAQAPRVHPWYTELWDPRPVRSLDAALAQMALIHFTAQMPNYQNNNRLEWVGFVGSCLVGAGGGSADPLRAPALPIQTSFIGGRAQQVLFPNTVDHGPPGSLYVALRAGRRALETDPDDPQVYVLLGQIYYHLSRNTRERIRSSSHTILAPVRQAQTIAALEQAVKLDPDLELAHVTLANLYRDMGFNDLAIKHRREQFRCVRLKGPTAKETVEQAAKRFEGLNKGLKQVENDLKTQEDRFEVMAANKPPLERAAMALSPQDPKYWLDPRKGPNPPGRFGLAEKALQALEDVPDKDMIVRQGGVPRSPAAIAQFDLLFQMGRLAEIRDRLSDEQQPILGRHPDLEIPAYALYQVRLAGASGDYARAEEAFDKMREEMTGEKIARGVSNQLTLQLAQYLLLEAGHVTGMPLLLRSGGEQLERQMRQLAAGFLADLADQHALRGWLSLEAGRLKQAREHLERAETVVRDTEAGYSMRPLVRVGLQWLDRNAR